MQREFFIWMALISTYLLTRVAERRMHRSNYDFLVFAGGEERAPRLMRWWYALGSLILPLAALEYFLMGPLWLGVHWRLLGWALVSVGLALRVWSIRSLGRLWSLRCIFISGFPVVKTGPYGFIRHPEYLSRVLEGLGICLFLGIAWTAVGFLALALVFIWRITGIENQQIRELAMRS